MTEFCHVVDFFVLHQNTKKIICTCTCDHVILTSHLVRKRSPYKWRSGVNVLRRNSIRLAEVTTNKKKRKKYLFHFTRILCQPLFLNYAKHICRVLSPIGLIFVCTVIMTVPLISTYFFLRFGWTSTKSIIMTGTYLLFQSDVSLYGAFLDGLDNKKNNCSSLH